MQQTFTKYFISLYFWLIIFQLNAQNYHINYEHITTKQGLSNNFINHIIQDKEGFIWIATNDGLNRYDGYHFKTFRVNLDNPDGLSSNIITYLQEDKKGNIWIGTDKGLAKLNIKTGEIKNIAFFENKKIHNIHRDSQNRLWIIADKHYIFLVKDENHIQKTKVNYFLENQKYMEFYGVIEKKINDEYLLFAHYMDLIDGQEYLYFFDETKQTWQLALHTSHKIEYIDDSGKLYFVQKQDKRTRELIIQNYKKQVFRKYQVINLSFNTNYRAEPYRSEPRNLHWIKKNHNQIYIGILNQIFKINTRKGEVVMLLDIIPIFKQIKNGFKMTQLFQDKAHNIWIGTEDGIFIFPQYAFQNFKIYNNQDNGKLSGSSTRAIYQDKEGNTWISNYNSKYTLDILLKNGQHKSIDTKSIAFKITPDSYNKKILWVTSGSELLKVNKQNRKVLNTYHKERPIGYIRDILQINKHKMYLAGDQGLGLFDSKNEALKTYSDIQFTTCIFRDKNQKVWLGSRDKGLGLLNEKIMQVQYFAYDKKNLNSISSNHIKCIYEDKKGRFWVATTLGLNLFNRETKTFMHFTEKDGLPNNMVYAILEDEKNNLWLSTNTGISKFNPETKEFINYDDSYGLQDNEFNTNSYFKNEHTGEMFFGGVRGVNSFFPEDMKKNNIPPSLVLTAFKRKGKKVNLGKPLNEVKKIEMAYDEAQTLTFEFVALSFFQSRKNRYKYRIEGLQEDWINLGTKHELTLTNLNAGTYILHVKGSNNHGLWNEKGLKIMLVVKPPFWQTGWFISCLVLAFLLCVYGIYRWRIYRIRQREKYLEQEVNIRTEEIKTQAEALELQSERLEKQASELEELNKAKDRFFAIIAHDLRSPIAAFESIAKQLDFFLKHQEPERIKKLSKNIQRSAHNLNSLLNNLLNWALVQKNLVSNEPQLLDLETLVLEVISYYEETLNLHQIELIGEIPQNTKIYIDENALLTILRNLLNNAIKFTPKQGKIIIRSYTSEDNILIEIEDSGIGIEVEKIPNLFKIHKISKNKDLHGQKGTGLGLLLVWEFVQANKGKINVMSEKDKGTIMQLVFPKY